MDRESPVMLYNRMWGVVGAKTDIFALFCTWVGLNSTQYCDKCHSSACTLALIICKYVTSHSQRRRLRGKN